MTKVPSMRGPQMSEGMKLAPKGYILEFGVFRGTSINFMASLTNETIYGFDSFEGLPEDWIPKRSKGYFAMDKLPAVASNVKLIVGWFKDTIPEWKVNHTGNIGFIHVDCDLYSSTKTIFDELNSQIIPGTIIAFDELLNYREWLEHEWKALNE